MGEDFYLITVKNNLNTIGIDFGTHKTLVARWDESISRPVLVRLRPAHGDDMPSSVHVDRDGKMSFGDEADRLGALDPDGYQRAFKRDLGIDAAPYLLHTHEFTAADLSREYLRWIKNIVETECLHDTIGHAVFTVPATWLPGAREALRKTATDAGFASLDLVDEPVAAGMAFLHSRRDLWPEGALMVFDWGAGTLDLAVLTLENGQPRAIPDLIDGKSNLGGEDIDRHLVQSVNKRLIQLGLTKLERRPPEDLEQVRRSVTEWKVRHSAKPDEVWQLPAFAGSTDAAEMKWTSAEVAERIEEKIKEAIDFSGKMLERAVEKRFIPKGLLLVGGSSQFPKVKLMFESRFPDLKIFTWDQRISAVAIGAAYEASGAESVEADNPEKEANIGQRGLSYLPCQLGGKFMGKIMETVKSNLTSQFIASLGFTENDITHQICPDCGFQLVPKTSTKCPKCGCPRAFMNH